MEKDAESQQPQNGAGSTHILWSLLRMSKVLGAFPAKNVFRNRDRGPKFSWGSWEVLWTFFFAAVNLLVMYDAMTALMTNGNSIFTNLSSTDLFAVVVMVTYAICNVLSLLISMTVNCSDFCRLVRGFLRQDDLFREMRIQLPKIKEELFSSFGVLVFVPGIIRLVSVYLIMQGNNHSMQITAFTWPQTSRQIFAILQIMVEYLPFFLIHYLCQALALRFSIVDRHLKDLFFGHQDEDEDDFFSRSSLRLFERTEEFDPLGMAKEEKLAFLCKTYQRLCKMVDACSSIFGWYLLVISAFCICGIVTCIYSSIQSIGNSPWEYSVGVIFTCLAVVLKMGVFLVGLSNIPEQARAVQEYLWQIDLMRLSKGCQVHIRMLMQKTACPVEVTAANFFSINRRLLTSIAAAVTTYLVVLLQFKLGEDNRH